MDLVLAKYWHIEMAPVLLKPRSHYSTQSEKKLGLDYSGSDCQGFLYSTGARMF